VAAIQRQEKIGHITLDDFDVCHHLLLGFVGPLPVLLDDHHFAEDQRRGHSADANVLPVYRYVVATTFMSSRPFKFLTYLGNTVGRRFLQHFGHLDHDRFGRLRLRPAGIQRP
jgi:hypothetical protein